MSATPNGAAAQPFVAHPIRLTLNGQARQLNVLPWTTLLDLLREQLDLVGSKKGCDHGQCGACTVLRDGKRVNACLTLAVMCDGAELTTIEGLADGDTLHPVQQAWLEEDVAQCGYCQPGQIMAAVALLKRTSEPTDADIDRIENVCRCGTYFRIRQAIKRAAELSRENETG